MVEKPNSAKQPAALADLLPDAAEAQRFRELTQKTAGADADPAEVAALRLMLAEHTGLWRHWGGMGKVVLKAILGPLKNMPGTQAAFEREAVELQAGMGYEMAPPLERLLIEQVVIASTQLKLVQMFQAVQPMDAGHGTDARFWDERVMKAHGDCWRRARRWPGCGSWRCGRRRCCRSISAGSR